MIFSDQPKGVFTAWAKAEASAKAYAESAEALVQGRSFIFKLSQ